MSYSLLIAPEQSAIRYITVPVRLVMAWIGSKVENKSVFASCRKLKYCHGPAFISSCTIAVAHELIYQLYPTCILENWFDALVSSIYTAQYQIDKQRTLIENKIFLLCMQYL